MPDLDALRAPIAGDAPGGIFLKGDRSLYRGLRNAFNAAQSAYRALSETQETFSDRELQQANATAWAALAEDAEKTLTESSKDLEILCWWTASQLHGRDPILRSADALTLLADLVEADLDGLQPTPPEEKLKGDTDEAKAAEIAELKLRPFLQLFGEVDGSGLLFVPLTNADLGGEVTHGDFIVADRDGDLSALRAALTETFANGTEALTAKVEALQAMSEQTERLQKVLQPYAATHKTDAVPFGFLDRHVKSILGSVERLTEGTGFQMPGTELEEAAADAIEDGAADAPTGAGGGRAMGPLTANIDGREAALAQIAELARFFRKTEPHSPIPTLLDRAVRWGQMPAEQLFQEILSDGSEAYNQMTLMTGLESAGFADRYKGKGSAPAAAINLPQLDSYDAPKPQAATAAAPTASAESRPDDARESDGGEDEGGGGSQIASFEL